MADVRDRWYPLVLLVVISGWTLIALSWVLIGFALYVLVTQTMG